MKVNRKLFAKETLLILFSSFLSATGIYLFKFPNHFTTGGVTGLGVVLNHIWPTYSQAMYTNIMNIGITVIGLILLGKSFGIKTLIYTGFFTIMIALYDRFLPLTAPLTNQPFMELILAVLVPAIGGAIMFDIGGSTGGTDVIAMLLKKYGRIYNTSTALLLADIFIGALAFVVFDVQTGLFSVFGLLVRSVLTESVLTGLNQRKYFHIITDHSQLVKDYITNELKRSATLFEGEGAFTGDKRTLVLTVVSPRQAIDLRNFVRKNSPESFLLITNTSEIFGRGFKPN